MYVDSNGFSLLRSLVGNRMYNTAGIVSHIDIALVPRPATTRDAIVAVFDRFEARFDRYILWC